MKLECFSCSAEFESDKPRKYCSKECLRKEQYDNPEFKDKLSKAISKRNEEYLKKGINIVSKAQNKRRERGLEKFKTNPAMKLGKRGYLLIYVPKGTDEWKKGWRYYHHWVWEKATGKRIEKGFCIHHKDRNPKNNNIENLQYMTIAEHDRLKCKERNELAKSI